MVKRTLIALSNASFPNLEIIFKLAGPVVSADKLAEVIRYQTGGQLYYIKRSWQGTARLNRWLGRSRLTREFNNLQFIKKMGFNTPEIVCYIEERIGPVFKRGAMISKAVPDAHNLQEIISQPALSSNYRQRITKLLRKLAAEVRKLHATGFVYTSDLKPRNILVDANDKLYYLDCPNGKKLTGYLLKHYKIKDLAIFYYFAQAFISRSQALKLYLIYANKNKLDLENKKIIAEILKRVQEKNKKYKGY